MPSITPDEPLPRPLARHVPADFAVRWTELGHGHCEAPKCREPIAIETWRRYRWHGQVRSTEHFFCTGHGEAFALRYGIEIGPWPSGPAGSEISADWPDALEGSES
jgi:hypothetical protein